MIEVVSREYRLLNEIWGGVAQLYVRGDGTETVRSQPQAVRE